MMKKSVCWAIMILVCMIELVGAEALGSGVGPMVLSSAQDSWSLGRHVAILTDPSGKLTIYDVSGPPASKDFVQSSADALDFGFNAFSHWLRFTLSNRDTRNSEWVLWGPPAPLNHVDLYFRRPGGDFTVKRSGDAVPFKEWDIPYRRPSFRIKLDPGESLECYVRLASSRMVRSDLVLSSMSAFSEHERTEKVVLAAAGGALAVVILYNLFFWIALRDRIYGSYLASVIFTGLFLATFQGWSFQYLWPGRPEWNDTATMIFMGLQLFFTVVFTRDFLQSKEYSPHLDQGLRAAKVCGLGACVLSPFAPQASVAVAVPGLAAWLIAAVLIAIKGALRGHRPALYYLVGYAIFFIGFAHGLLVFFDIFSYTELGITSMGIGLPITVLVLSFALVERFSNIERDSSRSLEREVEKRTAELAIANRALTAENIERLKAQEALRQSEQLLNSILNASPIAIAYYEKQKLKWLNAAMTEMFGDYDYRNMSPKDFFASHAEFEQVLDLFRGRIKVGKPTETEAQFKRADGSVFPGLLFLSPMEPNRPEQGDDIAIVMDLSEKKSLEQNQREIEERYRNLVEESFDGILIHDGRTITFANSPLHEMLGFGHGELVGMEYWQVFHPDSRELVRDRSHARLNNQEAPRQYEVMLQRKDGASFPGEVIEKTVQIGFQRGLQVWIRDVSERKKAEQELSEGREMLRTILALSPVAIGMARRRKLVWANRAFMTMFGFVDQQECADISTEIIYASKEEFERIGRIQYAKLKTEDFAETDALLRRQDGTPFDGHMTLAPMDKSDPTEGIIAAISDISERKRSEEALRESEERLGHLYEESKRREELYRSLLNSSPDAVILYDMEGRVQYVNPSFTYILGWTSEDVAGERIDFVPESERQATMTIILGLIADGTPVSGFETKRYTQSGKLLEVSISASRYRDHLENPAGILVIIRNISERKKAERELENALESARRLRAQAEAASKAKSDFVANMSHEIRTPMNAVIGLTELGLRADPSPKLNDYLTKIRTSAKSLLGIINDILDFSKIEAGRLDIEFVEFDLRDIMRDLTSVLGEMAARKGLEFVVFVDRSVPCGLKGDPLRLRQVLMNLANNAIKFTHYGEIVVRAALVQKDSKRATIHFSVKDSGVGLSADKIPKLFDSFFQADGSTTRKYGGSGLGLTITKRLVEMMGGKIHVESEPEKGSMFFFALEFEFQEKIAEETVPRELSGLKVLVVDDNEAAREILLEILSSVSIGACAVESGETALEVLVDSAGGKPYDLVLMDWNMPGLNGIETSKLIDRDPRLAFHIPKIIMVTAYGNEDVMREAQEAGLDGFLVKPVDQALLLDTILDVFGKQPMTKWVPDGASAKEADAVRKIRGARILVVEDNEINQQVAREILEGAGIVVAMAGTGVESVRAVSESDFDAVLMDVQMPEMDGYEATRTIRSDPRYNDLPIIAMTAHALKGERERCIEAGMNDHVTKPIDIEELLTTLARWVLPAVREPGPRVSPREKPEPTRADELPELLGGINIDAALRRLGGNKRLFKKLLGDCRRDIQNAAEEIKDAWNKGDMEVTQRLAHTIKGVAGNIGAENLYVASRELESVIKQGQVDEFHHHLALFAKALEQVLESIASLGSKTAQSAARKPGEEPTAAFDAAKVGPLLVQLAACLRGNDFRAIECLEAVKAGLEDSGHDEQLLGLEACVGRFDFNSASDMLAQLALALNIPLSGTEQ
ncbi:MAG: PAS domain S-box protein [Pseudomonadota bacterium]